MNQASNQANSLPHINARLYRFGRYSILFQPRSLIICSMMVLVLIAGCIIELMTGPMRMSVHDVFATLFNHSENPVMTYIVQELRLPRVITGVFAGAALGISGTLFQSISRNVLGSPDVIGFTTGAATGALVQIVVFNQSSMLLISISTIVCGLLTALLVFALARSGDQNLSGDRLVLIGVGVGAMLGALNGLMLVYGQIDNAIIANLWLSGSMDARNWTHAIPVFIGVVILAPIALKLGRQLELMEMGDDLAHQLGINVRRVRIIMALCAVILAALATGAIGPVAFVALAAPQLARRLSGNGKLPLVSAMLMGSLIIIIADLLTLYLPTNLSIPIGRMTGCVGGIYLLWLLLRMR